MAKLWPWTVGHHDATKRLTESPAADEAIGDAKLHDAGLMRVGCWNVRTTYTARKAAQVAREMERYRLDIMGISDGGDGVAA